MSEPNKMKIKLNCGNEVYYSYDLGARVTTISTVFVRHVCKTNKDKCSV